MPNYQQITAVGHIGQDPELRHTTSGHSVLQFSLAVTEKWKNGEHTEWFRCTLWGERAEKLVSYIHKGDPLMVVGSIRTEKYTAKDGTEKQSTKLNVREMQFLRGRDKAQRREEPATEGGDKSDDGYDGDDIPF